MIIYIVSYTRYDEHDKNLYTWRRPLINWQDALDLYKSEVEIARADLSSENENCSFSLNEKEDEFEHVFERQDPYSKIVVEITSHAI